jgi:hypothetical protein
MNWTALIYALIAGGISVWLHFSIKWIVKAETKDLIKKVDNVIESYSTTARFAGITNRITKDFIYTHLDRKSLIDALLNESYNLNDLHSYGFDKKFLNEFYIEATKRQLEWAKNLEINENEPDRNIK